MISIILPTYNEAENIIPLIEEINRSVRKKKEIIVVDDSSPDGTAELARKYRIKKKTRFIRVLVRKKDKGLTRSIQKGIDAARGKIVVWMDCDFSMPPYVINALTAKIIEGYDVAVGSRYVKGGSFKRNISGSKDSAGGGLLSRLMNCLIQILLGRHFRDYTSGFAAVRKNVFKQIRLKGDYGEYFIDFIFRSFTHNLKISEVGFVCMPRKRGVSKTGKNAGEYIRRGKNYMKVVLGLGWEKYIVSRIK